MSKDRKFYEGIPEELNFYGEEKYEYTKENFELGKKWLDIKLKLGYLTQEKYEEELKKLKEEHNIKVD